VGEFASSPGMVSETFVLVKASGLTRVGDGGGVAGEDIVVHRVALCDIGAFIAQQRASDRAIDVKLLTLLGPALIGR
jgi:ADP-ribose pyrophosphatase